MRFYYCPECKDGWDSTEAPKCDEHDAAEWIVVHPGGDDAIARGRELAKEHGW